MAWEPSLGAFMGRWPSSLSSPACTSLAPTSSSGATRSAGATQGADGGAAAAGRPRGVALGPRGRRRPGGRAPRCCRAGTSFRGLHPGRRLHALPVRGHVDAGRWPWPCRRATSWTWSSAACLSAFCVTLGLLVSIHHCAKRDGVWHCWWSCCPARRDPHSAKLSAPPCPRRQRDGWAMACLQDSPCPGKALGFSHPSSSHCKMTNLQASQGPRQLPVASHACAQAHCEAWLTEGDSPRARGTPSSREHTPARVSRAELAALLRPAPGRRGRAGVAYHIPVQPGRQPWLALGKPAQLTRGPRGCSLHALACCAQERPLPLVSQPEAAPPAPCCTAVRRGPAEGGRDAPGMLRRTQSLPFGGPARAGCSGATCGMPPRQAPDTGSIPHGPWRDETTV